MRNKDSLYVYQEYQDVEMYAATLKVAATRLQNCNA